MARNTESAGIAKVRVAREVKALLEMVAADVAALESDRADWATVGSLNHVREQLLELAAGARIGADGSEDAARERALAEIAAKRVAS